MLEGGVINLPSGYFARGARQRMTFFACAKKVIKENTPLLPVKTRQKGLTSKSTATASPSHDSAVGTVLRTATSSPPSGGAVCISSFQVAAGRKKVFERSEFFFRLKGRNTNGVSTPAGWPSFGNFSWPDKKSYVLPGTPGQSALPIDTVFPHPTLSRGERV